MLASTMFTPNKSSDPAVSQSQYTLRVDFVEVLKTETAMLNPFKNCQSEQGVHKNDHKTSPRKGGKIKNLDHKGQEVE